MATNDLSRSNVCLNCGSPVTTRYCGACGQEAVAPVVTFRELISSTIDTYLSLDSKLARSLVPFLRHPGLLSEQFVRGRRQQYVSPVRLYLVSSLLFFVVASFFVDRSESGFLRITNTSKQSATADSSAAATVTSVPVDSAGGHDMTSAAGSAGETAPPLELDSLGVDLGGSESADADTSGIAGSSSNLAARFLQRLFETEPQVISAHFLRQLPRVLFVLVPVFALLLKLLYVRRSRLYIEHLVLALHAHAFLFLIATPAVVSRYELAGPLVMLITGLYTYLSMKRFYAQGWLKTLVKFTFLQASYSVVIAAAMMLTLVFTVLFAVR